jgi:transposase
MTEKRTRRKYTKEFKVEALRLCERKPVVEVAESLGVSTALLYRWRRAQSEEGADAFRGNGNRTALEEEIHRLRKENAELREEKEILKKASAYFAKHQK